MKKIKIITMGALLGFGLLSCGKKEGAASTGSDSSSAAADKEMSATSDAQTVSLNVTGMT